MCLLCLYSPQHHTTPNGLGDHWKPGCKRQMWSSCVPAPSYSCVSVPELSVLDHKSVGNIISPCPNSQKVVRKNCSNSYRRVNSIGKFQYLHWIFVPLTHVHMLGFVHPETTDSWKNRAFSVLFLIRNALVVLCPLLPGASAKVPVGGCSGCGCTGGRMEKWYKKMKLIYKFGAELAKNFETVLRSVFFKICPDFKYLLLLGLHGSLVASSAQVVSMNLILYGSLAMVAFSKPWRAMVCNF